MLNIGKMWEKNGFLRCSQQKHKLIQPLRGQPTVSNEFKYECMTQINSAIALLRTYLIKYIYKRHTKKHFLLIVESREQPKCPGVEKWIKTFIQQGIGSGWNSIKQIDWGYVSKHNAARCRLIQTLSFNVWQLKIHQYNTLGL